MVSIEIVNVVTTADLKQPVDILIAGQFKDFLYDSEKYGGRVVYYKSKGMKGRVTIFRSGKMISVGTRSVDDAFNNLKLALNALLENKLAKSIILDMKIRNIVATINFMKPIDLEKTSQKLGAIYEPDQFSGAILYLKKPKVTTLLFSSGKVVITGAKKNNDFNEAVSQLSKLLF